MIRLGSDKDGKVVMGIMALIGNGKIASNPPNPDDLVVVGECSVSLHKRICIHLFNAFSYYSSFIHLLSYILEIFGMIALRSFGQCINGRCEQMNGQGFS